MQMGLSDAEVTFYTSWLYLPWVIKPLWSPFLDLIKTKRWWIIIMQLLVGAAFAGVCLYGQYFVMASRNNLFLLVAGIQ